MRTGRPWGGIAVEWQREGLDHESEGLTTRASGSVRGWTTRASGSVSGLDHESEWQREGLDHESEW